MADAVRLVTSTDGNDVASGWRHPPGRRFETGLAGDFDGVVDLSGLGLDMISVDVDTLTIGAMVSLTEIAEHKVVGELADGILRRAARGEGPLNLRNVATIGGVVATAKYDSEFYAALLALDGDGNHQR